MKNDSFISSLTFRYDLFVIWANGIKYINEIIERIEAEGSFDIILVQEYKPKSMKSFISHVYDFEYAPKIHLVSKTRYLNKLKHEVIYILVKNYNPDEVLMGEGRFQHIESRTIKQFKEVIRNEFNEYVEGKRTENHVIHATDNEQQTDSILKYLRNKGGLIEFQTRQILDIPFHIGKINDFEIISVDIEKLYARILIERGNILVPIKETPQYVSITKGNDEYQKYLNKYQYKRLTKTFRKDKLDKLYETITLDSYIQYGNYIIVREIGKDRKLLIADGVHRCAALLAKGYREIPVVKELNKWN